MKHRSIAEIIKNEFTEIEEKRVEMLNSLCDAVLQAGGDPSAISDAVICENMTVVHLIDWLAQNNIRFIYSGKD